ncbi:MAG: metallopeptidase TldD-related protein [Sphingomonadaceae bacterium]|nr:metallopeptidase TldD-related protein [Sphingomonadaceae bacterium]
MTPIPQALDLLSSLVARARALGADAADAAWSVSASESVSVRLGALEDVARSETADISLRVFLGQQSAAVSGSDLRPAALGALAERAIAMAREALPDPYAGLADPALLLRGPAPDLALADPDEPGATRLREDALAAEDAARAVAGVTNSEGAGASFGRGSVALVTSTGFAQGYVSTSHSLSAVVIAGEGADMQRDYAMHSTRRRAALDNPELIGRRAGERTVARLKPVKIASGAMPVVFDPRVSGSLIGHLLGAMSGPGIARQSSFLIGKLGTRVLPAGVNLIEQPLRLSGLRSKPFDGEGLATNDGKLIDDGMLTGWLLDSPSARQLGLAPNGHAARGGGVSSANVYLEADPVSRDALIAGISRGILVTELIGMGVNGVTGDYSRGAAGFLIENGAIAGPVAEITIAGNLLDMYARLSAADDLEFRRGVDAPTLLIEGMTVAGS